MKDKLKLMHVMYATQVLVKEYMLEMRLLQRKIGNIGQNTKKQTM